MIKVKKILAPVDLSELSTSGLRHALDLAQWQQSEVVIYHVVTVEETPFPQGNEEWVASQTENPKLKKIVEQRRKRLDAFVRANFSQALLTTTVRQEVGIGTPYKTIVDAAVAEAVDLIVMSTHGRTGLAHMLIGSVTERVLRRAPCPVLAVPPPKRAKRAAKRIP
jgi:nucleotide-binding universal stress UspA family protein